MKFNVKYSEGQYCLDKEPVIRNNGFQREKRRFAVFTKQLSGYGPFGVVGDYFTRKNPLFRIHAIWHDLPACPACASIAATSGRRTIQGASVCIVHAMTLWEEIIF